MNDFPHNSTTALCLRAFQDQALQAGAIFLSCLGTKKDLGYASYLATATKGMAIHWRKRRLVTRQLSLPSKYLAVNPQKPACSEIRSVCVER